MFVACLPLFGSEGDNSNEAIFTWNEISALTTSRKAHELPGINGAFSGVHNEVYIIAGGIRSIKRGDESENIWSDEIYVLEKNTDGNYQWNDRNTNKLPQPLAQGVAITTTEGILCIGGSDENECSSAVYLLRWNSAEQQVEIETRPSLPRPLALMSGAKIGNSVYIAGGQESINNARATNNFWTLNLVQVKEENNHWR